MIVTPPFDEAKLEKLWANIALLEFRRQLVGAIAVEKMLDGVVDEYEDETGIDTANSSANCYNSSSNFYSPEALVQQATSGAAAAAVGKDAGGNICRAAQSFQISESSFISAIVLYFLANNGSPTGGVRVRIETDNAGLPSGTLANASASVDATITINSWTTFAFSSGFTLSAGTFWIVISAASTQTAGNYFRPSAVAGNLYANGASAADGGSGFSTSGWSGYDFTFKVQRIITSMLLKSNAFSASAQATKARIFIFEEDIDVITPNTDLLAYASRDGGTTWSQAPIATLGAYETGKNIIGGVVDISGQPAGTSMKYKIETANNKNLKIKGAALLWQ